MLGRFNLLAAFVIAFSALPGVADAAERGRAEPPGLSPICDPGFAPIAGTRTCVKVGGQVRSEASVGKGRARAMGADARVRLEARTMTDYGPARGVIEMRAGNIPRGPVAPYAR